MYSGSRFATPVLPMADEMHGEVAIAEHGIKVLLVEDDPTDGFLLHCRQDMRVDVHRHADLAMAQQFLHHFGMDADAQKHGG